MDHVKALPTLTGAKGRAWEVPIKTLREALKNPADSSIGIYCVEAPYAHGVWHSYMIAMIHLRPIPGFPPAKINRPNATHEIMVCALNPEYPREPFIKGLEQPHHLTPFNFIGQIVEPNDSSALDVLLKTVNDVIDARLSPDTDYIKFWTQRFGEYCLKPGWDRGTILTQGGKSISIPPHEPPKGDTRKLN